MKKRITALFLCTVAFITGANEIIFHSFEYMPYVTGDARIDSITSDLLKEIFNTQEYKLIINTNPMARAFKEFDTSSLNAVTIRSITSMDGVDWFNRYDFIPIGYLRRTFLLRKESPDIKSKKDFKNIVLAELTGSGFIKDHKKNQVKKLDLSPTHDSNIFKLYHGRVDAIHSMDLTLMRLLNKHYPDEKEMFKFSSYEVLDTLVIVVDKKNPALKKFLINRLKAIIKSGTYYSILEKYYQGDVPGSVLLKVKDLK